ncbi:Wzz/FepE/Etk N-terminal domain-containing protein [Rhodosalinus sp. FB01]|uniref:Wzz/FepE/Etk N-terminal domain-containing protein n=1 Tax=Rhodosalinus sp. FB01 TaxID=3239194 RepID=UPI0035259AF0
MRGLQSLDEFVAMMRRRAWAMILVAAFGCTASLWYALQQPRVYEASATVQIRSAMADGLSGPMIGDEYRVARQIALIERRMLARDTIASLVERYRLYEDLPDLDRLDRIARLRRAISLEDLPSDRLGWMQGGSPPSGLILRVRLEDPEMAAIVANDLMGLVLAQSNEGLVERTRMTRAFLEDEERRLVREIDALEGRIAEFKRRNTDALPENVPVLRAHLHALRETGLEIEGQIIALQATPGRADIEATEDRIERLETRQARIAERIERIEESLAAAPEVERQFGALSRALLQLEERFEAVTRHLADAELRQGLADRQAAATFEILETAMPPASPDLASRRNIAVVGTAASLVAAVLLALFLELLDPTIRSPAELERRLGVRPIVSVPTIRGPSGGGRRRLTVVAA